MSLFGFDKLKKSKETRNSSKISYDPAAKQPVIKCSICTGEQVAGFKDLHTKKFEDIMLIRTPQDLEKFCSTYGIENPEALEKIY